MDADGRFRACRDMGLKKIINPGAYKETFLKRERRFCVFGAICGYEK
jgi:hypothetical protein